MFIKHQMSDEREVPEGTHVDDRLRERTRVFQAREHAEAPRDCQRGEHDEHEREPLHGATRATGT